MMAVGEAMPRDAVLQRALDLLDAPSLLTTLASCALVSRRWRTCAYRCAVWERLCRESGVDVPDVNTGTWREALLQSVLGLDLRRLRPTDPELAEYPSLTTSQPEGGIFSLRMLKETTRSARARGWLLRGDADLQVVRLQRGVDLPVRLRYPAAKLVTVRLSTFADAVALWRANCCFSLSEGPRSLRELCRDMADELAPADLVPGEPIGLAEVRYDGNGSEFVVATTQGWFGVSFGTS